MNRFVNFSSTVLVKIRKFGKIFHIVTLIRDVFWTFSLPDQIGPEYPHL